MARALGRIPRVKLAPGNQPRLVEFCSLGCALAEVTGGSAAEFMAQFEASRQDGIARTIDASPVAAAVVAWLEKHPAGVYGPAKTLFESVGPYRPQHADPWPRSSKGFADGLRRVAPALRALGIEVRSHGRIGGNVYWSIERRAEDLSLSSPASPENPFA